MCAIDPVRDLVRTGAFYGAEPQELARTIELMRPHLHDYFEIVLAERSFEAITGGAGRHTAISLARIASLAPRPLCTPALDAFLDCDARFPGRALGLKIVIGEPASPSLYCRIAAPREEALAWLGALAPLRAALPDLSRRLTARIVYGLGFFEQDGELAAKTYELDEVEGPGGPGLGFVSHRIGSDGCAPVHKEYRPSLPIAALDGLPASILRLGDFARTVLDVHDASHLAWTSGEPRAYKLYLERIGAIPTDASLR